MSTDLRPIRAPKVKANFNPVAPWTGDVQLIEIGRLKINGSYQRNLTEKSARAAISIARTFDWDRFGVVICRPVEGVDPTFEVIDGQHRCIAANLVGVKAVPCMVTRGKAADTFLGVNKTRTSLSPLAIYHAEVAAGEQAAVAIARIAATAGVKIRKSQPPNGLPVGETVAIGSIKRIYADYGEKGLAGTFRALRRSEVNATPLDPSALSAGNIRAVAQLFSMESACWAGSNATLADAIGTFLEGQDQDRLQDEAAILKIENGRPLWQCIAIILRRKFAGEGTRQ